MPPVAANRRNAVAVSCRLKPTAAQHSHSLRRQSEGMNFGHRQNRDGSRDSVCQNCFQVVVENAKVSDKELDSIERKHECTAVGNDVLENMLRLMARRQRCGNYTSWPTQQRSQLDVIQQEPNTTSTN
jgi:hypothetical protein